MGSSISALYGEALLFKNQYKDDRYLAGELVVRKKIGARAARKIIGDAI